MKKVKILGVIILMVAIAFIGMLLFMRMEADQVKNNPPSSQTE